MPRCGHPTPRRPSSPPTPGPSGPIRGGPRAARSRRAPARRPAGRPRPGRDRPRPGPGEPDRRAHRLQRRARPPGCDRPRDPDRPSPPRPTAGSGSPSPRPARPPSSTSTGSVDRTGTWIDYVAGTARRDGGRRAPDRRASTASWPARVPVASGLSSSAALELATAWALSGPDGPATDRLTLARIAQRAENAYVGVMCGLMDQFASANGVAGAAVLLDCRSLDHRVVPLPAGPRPGRRPHGDAADARDVRVQRPPGRLRAGRGRRWPAVEPGVGLAARRRPGDARSARRPARSGRAPPGRARRRRERPGRRDRGSPAGRRSRRASGDCSRRATPRCATCSRSARRSSTRWSRSRVGVPGVVASRMTGAGFGGCTISLVRPEAVDELRARILREYPARTGRTPRVWVVRAIDGAGLVRRLTGAPATCPSDDSPRSALRRAERQAADELLLEQQEDDDRRHGHDQGSRGHQVVIRGRSRPGSC